jgi:hypothetical protein
VYVFSEVRDASTQSLPLLDMTGVQVHLPSSRKCVPSFLLGAEPVCAPPTWQVAVSVPANQPVLRAWTERCLAQSPLSNQGVSFTLKHKTGFIII